MNNQGVFCITNPKLVLMLKYYLNLLIIILAYNNYAQKEYKSLFWKVYGNKLKDTSYLYGTMHTQDKRAFQFKDGVLEAFNRSNIYAMELNVDSINQAVLLKELIMDSTQNLKKLLSSTEYILVDQYFKDSMGLSLFFFDKISPIYTSQFITMKNLGSEQEDALDLFFHKKAKNQGKKIIGLEKMIEQIDAINSISYEKQAKELVNAVNKANDLNNNEIDDLISYYIKGDLESLLAITTHDDSLLNEYDSIINEIFIDKRNKKMADRCVKHLKENSTFIAIGAAHLPGENGVIELLRRKGFNVEAN